MIAERYVDAIVTYCEGMSTFPHRGNCRDDIRAGLRVTHYRGRTVIAFVVDADSQRLSILGVYYGGQYFETDLSIDVNE